jgi:chitodextrinase
MTTTSIQWAWGQNQQLNFNPATDKLDFGWFQSGQFTLSEVNGSVVISIPSNQQTYTLTGVKLSDLGMANILASDTNTAQLWSNTLGNPASAAPTPTPVPETNVIVNPPPVTPTPPSPASTTSHVNPISWSWGSHTHIAFNPAIDKLDFGWNFQSGQFSLTEINGSVVISIPSNDQTYTLTGVTLSQLSTSNFMANDSSTLSYLNGAIAGADSSHPMPSPEIIPTPVPTPTPTPTPLDNGSGASTTPISSYAKAWDAAQIYTAGQKVSVGDKVYEAKWWTQNETPAHSDTSASVWSFVGYMNANPVLPDAPKDLFEVNHTDKSAMLVWDAAEVNGVGTVSGYGIYQDGVLIGTTTSTYFKATGLEPNSTHTFTVEAYDELGASLKSTPISVTTDAVSQLGFDQIFSPYIDMSLSKSQDLVKIVDNSGVKDITLAFMLNSGKDQIGWGGVGTILNDGLPAGSNMLSQIEAVQHKGVDVTISFGGAVGSEPALTFSSAEALTKAYQSVIDRYHVNSLDFDIEGGGIANAAANHMRNEALVALDKANPDLNISFTLPVMPTGLTYEGINLLQQIKADGVNVDVINIMAMDYGAGADSGDMGQDAINAALATISQIKQVGLNAKVGITPMIGINDVQSEIFTIEDAQQLMAFAKDNPDVASIGMWSLGRDNVGLIGVVSPVGSGVEQPDNGFSNIFGAL